MLTLDFISSGQRFVVVGEELKGLQGTAKQYPCTSIADQWKAWYVVTCDAMCWSPLGTFHGVTLRGISFYLCLKMCITII